MVTTSFRQISHSNPIITTAIILWMCVILYLSFNFLNLESDEEKKSACQSLVDVINSLKTQVNTGSTNFQIFLKNYYAQQENSNGKNGTSPGIRHGKAHEILRRRSVFFAREIKHNIVQLDKVNEEMKKLALHLSSSSSKSSQLKSVESINNANKAIKEIKEQLLDISLYLQVDVDGLGRVDHALEFQIIGLNDLSMKLKNEFNKLQNPVDCKKAKYVIATLDRPCAFGCNAHHLMYCFQMAYATGRTLLLSTSGYSDTYTKWWIDNFLPLSDKCTVNDIQSKIIYNSINEKVLATEQAVSCPYINDISSSFPWIPPAVPNHISEELSHLHGAPFIWFAGQLASYLMRPKFDTSKEMKIFNNLSESPVVGIHVRRTDKINTEASFHSLEQYMNEVERYFQFVDARRQMMSRTEEWINDIMSPFHQRVYHQLKPVERRVYIATDDPSVFDEAKSKYKNYTFYGDRRRADSAGVHKRHSDDSIMGVVMDILILSKTDYIVCTFSSQVCRLAYELMQSNHVEMGDASQQFRTLDDIYYFGGQQASPYEVIIPDRKFNLNLGDLVHYHGNHWDGYAKVEKLSSSMKMIAPAFKFYPRLLTANMTGAH